MQGAGPFGGRVDEQPRFVRAEGDGGVGAHGGPPHLAGVGLDPARQIDGDDGHPVGRVVLHHGGGVRPQSAAPADAGDAVHDEVDVAAPVAVRADLTGVHHPAAGRQQGRRPALVGPAG